MFEIYLYVCGVLLGTVLVWWMLEKLGLVGLLGDVVRAMEDML